ncbi:hypothetical protein AB7828_03510 [Tardiphaga sp. 215_C5_N2_1]|uniref:hypothetical protein n=1 Tax=Tardiphaga sp. 215_C5_N2_1 TaxID=3240774 RepID=UPI003F897589
MPTVTQLVTGSFHVARGKYPAENRKWVGLSHVLAGRAGIAPMSASIQQAGEIDLLLRAMEDEFSPQQADRDMFAFHYQKMLSETWVLACYEFLRALRQRDREAADLLKKAGKPSEPDAVSESENFKALFEKLELLRMPIAKFEIAKDPSMKEPLQMRSVGPGPEREFIYDNKDPARVHIMPTHVTHDGRIGWRALNHKTSQEFTIERRSLSDQILGLFDWVEPAGLREARLKAEAEARPYSQS